MSSPNPRLKCADRSRIEMRWESLDQTLPGDHPVRALWQFVESLDLSDLLAKIRSLPGRPGAPAIDPKILVALWLQATVDGVGSGRELDRLCREHLVYRWLCGGVGVNYHTLDDFRVGHAEALDRLLTDVVAAMLHEGLIDLHCIAQDGMRVRASAGASSFRREKTLDACLEEARRQVETLRAQADEDAGAVGRRQRAAQQRAARERVARLEAAKAELEKLRAVNARQPKSRQKDAAEVRVSTTDPPCRKMKMPGGGFRPAYNLQFASLPRSGVIPATGLTNEGNDRGQLPPMLEQCQRRYGQRPQEALVDSDFVTAEVLEEVERKGTKIYAPIKKEKEQLAAGQDPYAPRPGDSEATAQWRRRMGTAEAKELYKQRASTAEWVNAQARNRGLYRVNVCGPEKVLAVALWYVLAHNYTCLLALRAEAAGEGARRG